jgi:hypothetical protein
VPEIDAFFTIFCRANQQITTFAANLILQKKTNLKIQTQ